MPVTKMWAVAVATDVPGHIARLPCNCYPDDDNTRLAGARLCGPAPVVCAAWRHIVDASSASLMPFVRESVATGSVVHTDGWSGYSPLESQGYEHEITFLTGKKNKTPPS